MNTNRYTICGCERPNSMGAFIERRCRRFIEPTSHRLPALDKGAICLTTHPEGCSRQRCYSLKATRYDIETRQRGMTLGLEASRTPLGESACDRPTLVPENTRGRYAERETLAEGNQRMHWLGFGGIDRIPNPSKPKRSDNDRPTACVVECSPLNRP